MKPYNHARKAWPLLVAFIAGFAMGKLPIEILLTTIALSVLAVVLVTFDDGVKQPIINRLELQRAQRQEKEAIQRLKEAGGVFWGLGYSGSFQGSTDQAKQLRTVMRPISVAGKSTVDALRARDYQSPNWLSYVNSIHDLAMEIKQGFNPVKHMLPDPNVVGKSLPEINELLSRCPDWEKRANSLHTRAIAGLRAEAEAGLSQYALGDQFEQLSESCSP